MSRFSSLILVFALTLTSATAFAGDRCGTTSVSTSADIVETAVGMIRDRSGAVRAHWEDARR